MKIAVTTPTGNVGSRLVPLLVQAGERPTVLVRDSSTLSSAVRETCDVVECDQGDADAVIRATAGVEALYWVNPPTEDDDPEAGYARMGASGAAAVRENQIGRVVFQSSMGAEARSGFGEIDGLGLTESLFDDTGAHITHLRCGYFFTNLLMEAPAILAGELTTTLPLDLKFPWVSPQDIATIAAVRLLSTSWTGRHASGVHGPADLSFADVASAIGQALGRTIVPRQVADADVAAPLRSLGMTEAQVDGILGMARGMRSGYPYENPRTFTTTTPTTLESWAYANLRSV
jgi:uncharacterized protein YbjT (DUF2867 family)